MASFSLERGMHACLVWVCGFSHIMHRPLDEKKEINVIGLTAIRVWLMIERERRVQLLQQPASQPYLRGAGQEGGGGVFNPEQ